MIGTLVGIRYEVVQELDSNPLFLSFRAMDRHGGKDVRIRVLEAAYYQEKRFVQALQEHAEKLRHVSHPSLERVLDVVDDGERLAVVTEHVAASTLDDRVKRLASFSVQLALSTAVSVCEALVAAHASGIYHGDVSGKNVLVMPSGTVKVAMTGFWATYSSSSRAGLAMLRGMAPYLAPEVTAGSMPSASSDVYSVGVLLYQMLSGRCPFLGDSTVAIATKHATAPYPSLRTMNPSVPEALDEVVKKCMSKSPDDRYQSMGELLTDLRCIQDSLRFGRPLTWPLRREAVEAKPVAVPVEEPEMKTKASKSKPKRSANESEGVPRWLVFLVYLSMIGFVAALGGWAWFNTHQPRLIEMPNVVYRNQAEAALELEKLGLRLSVERHESSEKYPAGVVLRQNPAAGPKKVKEGGIVQVVVSSGGRFVEVPDLRGRSIDEAKSLLQALNLEVSDDVEKVRDKDLAEGVIVSHVPEARKKVERGSRIKVRVSNGDKRVEDGSGSDSFTYRLRITMPPGAAPIMVRIDMTDDRETKTIHEEQHEPSESFEVQADGYGPEAMFRVFFDNELVDQINKKAEGGQ